MDKTMAIVLAAGKGKRMKSITPKVVHDICGKAMIEWVLQSLKKSCISKKVLVIGHKSDTVKECVKDKVIYALQKKQLGTGHAVMQAEKYINDDYKYVFILCGDTPLISNKTITQTIKYHKEQENSATIVTACLSNPSGYGRIIRNEKGIVQRIIEETDLSQEQKHMKEINSGIYCFTTKYLLSSLKNINSNNNQNEYYLTDTIEELISNGNKVGAITVEDTDEIIGVNDRVQLEHVTTIMRKRINCGHMMSGVTIINSDNTYIDDEVKIGMDTIIYPGTILQGNCSIGKNCIIGPNSRLINSNVGNNVEINNSVVIESIIDEKSKIGPFAYLRPGSKIGKNVKIGDFVEVKNSLIGDNTKSSHLAYIGDANVGKNVNIGCGTIVVNYDGVKKHRTNIEDKAFIGCNVNLISPVTIRKNAYIAAGSTITKEVPGDSLAIARNRQIIKKGWVNKNK